MKNKGYDFAVDRIICHLQKYIRKSGTEGYIALCDLKSFFDNISHWAVTKLLHKQFSDLRLIGVAEDMIRQFDPHKPMSERKGLGLGSQISQLLAPAIAGYIDHFVKEKLRVKFYGRYMDDFYLIHSDKDFLSRCLYEISKECSRLGLTLSERKTHIVKLTHGFTFLKVRFYITPSGKIIRKIHPTSVTRERRKLKKLHKQYCAGILTLEDFCNSFQSWRSHAERFSAYRTIKSMERLFIRLLNEGGSHNALYQNYEGRHYYCRRSSSQPCVCV